MTLPRQQEDSAVSDKQAEIPINRKYKNIKK